MRSIGASKPNSSAVVLRFPVGAGARERLRLRVKPPRPVAAAPVIHHGGWYHEEAIEEERIRREKEGLTSH